VSEPPPFTDSRSYIAVVGSGEPASADAATLEAAYAVGRGVGEAGAVLVCGGLGGVMEAACRGARAGGGRTVGLLPGDDRREANPHVDIAIPTGMGELRNGLVVRASDALVAIGGEWGTLSEISLAMKTGVPVVGLGTWELGRDGEVVEGVVHATDPADAVRRVLALTQT
jgi:uncharacterized protein (TIGR00725 family)